MKKNEAPTIPRLLQIIARDYPDFNAQLSKNKKGAFQPVTFKELYGLAAECAAGLTLRGITKETPVGLLADNRKEWLIANLGILTLGAMDIPRGRDSTPQEIEYILKTVECQTCFIENQELLDKVLISTERLPALKTLILMDGRTTIPKDLPASIQILTFEELLSSGKDILKKEPDFMDNRINKLKAQDTATVIFTSGTTGNPKGVMLSHENFLHQVRQVPHVADIQPGDIWLSVLPVWHSFERIVQYIALYTASTLAYSKPIGKIMLHDFGIVKPMWMASVPRIWEAIQEGVYRKVNAKGGISKALFTFFVFIGNSHQQLSNMLLGRVPQFKKRIALLDKAVALIPFLLLWPLRKLGDLLIFRGIRQKLGGRFQAGISGGGSLPASVDRFFAAAGITLLDGYGLTETAPVIAIRPLKNPVPYTMEPLPGTEIRIVDDQNNPVRPGVKGRIQARGKQIMKGYYKNPEATKAMISPDGWLDTGDLGIWTHQGQFGIRGRAKDTIVLRGGENLEPVPIEAALRESPLIEQAVVLGQDQKFLTALIVPDMKELENYMRKNAIRYHTRHTLIDMEASQEAIKCVIAEKISRNHGFKSFEQIYRFRLLDKSFEIGRELSAKQEIKRHAIQEIYKKEIAELYK